MDSNRNNVNPYALWTLPYLEPQSIQADTTENLKKLADMLKNVRDDIRVFIPPFDPDIKLREINNVEDSALFQKLSQSNRSNLPIDR